MGAHRKKRARNLSAQPNLYSKSYSGKAHPLKAQQCLSLRGGALPAPAPDRPRPGLGQELASPGILLQILLRTDHGVWRTAEDGGMHRTVQVNLDC